MTEYDSRGIGHAFSVIPTWQNELDGDGAIRFGEKAWMVIDSMDEADLSDIGEDGLANLYSRSNYLEFEDGGGMRGVFAILSNSEESVD